MRATAFLALPFLLLATSPLGAGAFPPDCVPAADATARPVDLGPGGVYYAREYTAIGATWVEAWRETNGVAGLQPDPAWNCGNPGDALLEKHCVAGTCPPTQIEG
jgi:hypothetical protein